MPARIIDWDGCFENNKSRGIENKTWTAIPNKQDALGYRILISSPEGPVMYACWIAMVLALSKQSVREGWITVDGTKQGRAMGPYELHLKTGLPAEGFQ